MTNDMLTYYTQPGPMTDPGPYAHLFDGLKPTPEPRRSKRR